MRSVLHYELGPVPWSLATPDGGLVKTDKSCHLHLLESGTQPVEDVPPMAALILDRMAVLQTTRPTGDTFSHLADQVFRYATQEWRLFIFISRESKWGTLKLKSAGNPRCAVPAESHSICTDRRRPGPAAALQVSPTSDTCQSVAILMNRPH